MAADSLGIPSCAILPKHPVNRNHMINKSFILILCTILLSSCAVSKQRAEISAPELHCDADITVIQNEQLDISDYCIVSPDGSVISIQGEADTSAIGEHTLSVLITDSEHNNFTLEEIAYIVVKPVPECPENAVYDEETEKCACIEGYVDTGSGEMVVCELKAVCGEGYSYRESDNTCVKNKPASTPAPSKPSQTQTPSNGQSQPSPSQETTVPETTPEPPSQPAEPEPTPAPQPTAESQPTPPPSSSGSKTCVPAGNSQQALDDAYNACALECSGHGNCEVYWDGSAYVANWH